MTSLPSSESTASFWHTEPSAFLLGHRTTPDLPSEVDIVIIGSGVTGASAARFLAEDERAKDLSIVMLDAREACWCATGRVCQPHKLFSLQLSSHCSNTGHAVTCRMEVTVNLSFSIPPPTSRLSNSATAALSSLTSKSTTSRANGVR